MIEALSQGLATTATGFACVIDGVLDVRTIADTAKDCAKRGIAVRFGPIAALLGSGCDDPTCDCTVRALTEACPDIKIVTVEIKVTEA